LDQVMIQVAEEMVDVARHNQKVASAQVGEAKAKIARAQADVERWESEVKRLGNLGEVVDRQVQEESKKQLRAYIAGREAAEASVEAAEATEQARKADVRKAQVDVEAAQGRAKVIEQAEQRLKALVGYTQILAPYDGIVLVRN